jgi:predicted nucleic acid-binding protein
VLRGIRPRGASGVAANAGRDRVLERWEHRRDSRPDQVRETALDGPFAAATVDPAGPARVNDTWVAACCVAYGLPLATLNIKGSAGHASLS